MTERPSAVRLYASDHPALAQTLSAKLRKACAEKIAEIGRGYASDWGDYQKRVGTIVGLEAALQLCAESEREISGE